MSIVSYLELYHSPNLLLEYRSFNWCQYKVIIAAIVFVLNNNFVSCYLLHIGGDCNSSIYHSFYDFLFHLLHVRVEAMIDSDISYGVTDECHNHFCPTTLIDCSPSRGKCCHLNIFICKTF